MKVPTKFVVELSEEEEKELETIHQTDKRARVRMRAHWIVLSHRGYSIDEIAELYEAHRNTVSELIDEWEAKGKAGLVDEPRPGRPRKVSAEEAEWVKKKLETDPRSIKGIAQELSEEKGEEIGPSVIRRLLQGARYVWKRMRKVPAQERDEEAFLNCQWELEVLQQKADTGKLDLYYFDEAGFSLTPCVPYGWQPVGQTWCLPAASGRQLNVLGFYSQDNRLDSYVFEGSIDSHVVAGCFDLFCERLQKPTVVVLDNASIHTSDDFEERIEAWARRGLTLKYLPPYCPELNLIEILWRKIKYEWLPLAAYASFRALAFELETVLRLVGSKYQITFV